MTIESLVVAASFGRPVLVVIHGGEPVKVNLTLLFSQQQQELEKAK